MTSRTVDVLIVGAGPAGLCAAARLARAGVGLVEVLERAEEPGGVPRHCLRTGFGASPGTLTGPGYARALTRRAVRAGAVVRTGATALGWAGPLTLSTVGRQGPADLTARAVVLATGARERPRAARLIPGSRPAGVLTTGELQQSADLFGQHIGTRAVVVGAEPVGHAAADVLRRAGAEVVALVTDLPAAQAPPHRTALLRLLRGVPVLTGTTVTAVHGRHRVSGLGVRHPDGRTGILACDTVVFSGDFVPERELARYGGLTLDPGTRGPAVDAAFRTSRPGVFAAGNVLHAAESARTAAREGADAAARVLDHLAGALRPPRQQVPVRVTAPLRWITPGVLAADAPPAPGRRFTLHTAEFLRRPLLVVRQDGRELHRERLRGTAVPGRPLALGASWTRRVDLAGGTVRVTAE